MSRARLNIFLEPDHARRLEELATLKGISKSGIIAASIAAYLSPDAPHQQGVTLGRRLDALSRQIDRLERDQAVLLETVALWVRHQIALDASFSAVIRQLQTEGVSNPTAHDAEVWIHKHFNAPFGLPPPEAAEKYFGEFYEQRVMTFHPASRFGDVPYSPNMNDDIIHLRRWLREVLAYVITGRHDPGHEEALREHAEK